MTVRCPHCKVSMKLVRTEEDCCLGEIYYIFQCPLCGRIYRLKVKT